MSQLIIWTPLEACRDMSRRRQFHREPRQPARAICLCFRLLKFKQILSFLTRSLQEGVLMYISTTLLFSCLHRNTCPGDTSNIKPQKYTHHVHCAHELCPHCLPGTIAQGGCPQPLFPGRSAPAQRLGCLVSSSCHAQLHLSADRSGLHIQKPSRKLCGWTWTRRDVLDA